MKKEDMMKAATLHADDVCKGPRYRWGHEQFAMVDFIEGAKWRINSVWHDIKEMPENNRMILIIMQHDIPTVLGPDNTFFKEEVKDRQIHRWAYVDDLLPDRKEDER